MGQDAGMFDSQMPGNAASENIGQCHDLLGGSAELWTIPSLVNGNTVQRFRVSDKL